MVTYSFHLYSRSSHNFVVESSNPFGLPSPKIMGSGPLEFYGINVILSFRLHSVRHREKMEELTLVISAAIFSLPAVY